MAKRKTGKRQTGKRGTGKRGKEWENYEQVAAYVLKQIGKRFRLSDVEGKQKIRGKRSGTEWEIDAIGIQESSDVFLIVECRRYMSSRLSQESVASIVYRISDTGASGGIIVSPYPLQQGAGKVAKAENIHHVQLDSQSTRETWRAKIEDAVHFGFTEHANLSIADSFSITVRDAAGNVVDQRSG